MTIKSLLQKSSLVLCALVAFGSVAVAMPANMGKSGAERFAMMDKNADGQVVREEFFESMPQMREGAFVAIDKDASNGISLEEWVEFSAGHSKGQMGGEAKEMPKGEMGQQTEKAEDGKANLVMPSRKAPQ